MCRIVVADWFRLSVEFASPAWLSIVSAGQAALCILGFLMRVWPVYGTWLLEWNQKMFVYCCEMCSVQCYEAGDSVAHVHMYLTSAVMLQAHRTAALVSISSLVSVVGKTVEPVAQ